MFRLIVGALRDGLLAYLNKFKVVGRHSDYKAPKKANLGSRVFLSIGELCQENSLKVQRLV
jgi:hypothetical protein